MPLERLIKLNTKDCLWIYILRLLKDKPIHAYTLRKEIEKKFGFKPGNVTSYKVLYLLKRRGFVNKVSKGRRIIYSITPKGAEALSEAALFYKKTLRLLK